MSNSASLPRLEAVQVLRAVAAVLVVLVHAINSNDFRTDMPRAWLGSVRHFNEFGASGVDMFFVLSGFVMSHAMLNPAANSARKFMVNRFIRVVPFYWLMTLLFFAAMIATGRSFESIQFVNTITILPVADPNIFVPPILIVGWTLAFELAFYFIVALAIAVAPTPEKRLTTTLLLTAFLTLTAYSIKPLPDLLVVWLSPIWFEFALGIIVYVLWRSVPRPVSSVLSSVFLFIGISDLLLSAGFGFDFKTVPLGIFDEDAAPKRVIAWAIPSVLVLLGLLWLSESVDLRRNIGWRWMQQIGDASYSLYLLHLGVIFVWEDLAPTNSVNADLVIALLVSLCVALALACYRWIEVPLITFLRKHLVVHNAPTRVFA